VASSLVPASPSDSAHRTVTALGIERDPRSIGSAQQTVSGDAITAAGETNLVRALAGRVAGADVSGSGASGTAVSLLLRGARTAAGNDQPLFVVDGVPVANQAIVGTQDHIDFGSSLADLDPNAVASITVLDGPNAAALYGSRAQNGVVLIATKSAAGTRGFSVSAKQDYTFESALRVPQFQSRYALGSTGVYSVGGTGAWGPAVYGTDQVQWWSSGQAEPLVAQPNSLRDFFVQGHTATTTAAVSAASSTGDLRLGITNVGQDGVQPNSGLGHLSTSLAAGLQALPRLAIRVNGEYGHADANHQPVQGLSSDNPVAAFLFTGSAADIGHLRTDALTDHQAAYVSAFGINNPYWDADISSNSNSRDHAIGAVSAAYAFRPWLNASIRTGIDWWHDHQYQRDPSAAQVGYTVTGATTYREQNSDFLLSVARPLGPTLGLAVDAGVATRGGRTTQNAAFISDEGGRFRTVESVRVKTNSAYGRTSVSFDSTVFLDATGRKDWMPDRAEFSPSVSAAWDMMHHAPNGLLHGIVSTGTLRASWAQVAGEDEFAVLDRTTSWEEGADLGFLRNRVSLSITHYEERTLTRTVVLAPVLSTQTRSLTVTDRGVELAVSAKAFTRANGLEWNLGLRFASNRSETQGMRGVLGVFGTHAQVVSGQPFGTIVTYVPMRDSLGRVIVENGLPMLGLEAVGSELPSWVGGLESDLRYKRFSMMLLVDSRHGGRVYSETNHWGIESGTLISTVGLRQRGGDIIVPGVNQDGTPNTTPVTAQQYYGYEGQSAAFTVFDDNAVELREARIGYTLEAGLAQRLHLTTIELAVIGRNLWVHTAVPNFDPQSVFDTGPNQGEEIMGVPSTRSLGLTVKIVP
ncbi:MAG TPA: TonB-dependent receptor plug domain-containing protein, partial [Gemmatimonadaceae bacterium]